MEMERSAGKYMEWTIEICGVLHVVGRRHASDFLTDSYYAFSHTCVQSCFIAAMPKLRVDGIVAWKKESILRCVEDD